MKNIKTPTKRYVNKRKIAPNKPIKTADALMKNAPIPKCPQCDSNEPWCVCQERKRKQPNEKS